MPARKLQYPPARGRYAPRQLVENLYDVRVAIIRGRPTAGEFISAVNREMRIRVYAPNTIKDYCNSLRRFLNWFGNKPHLVTRQDIQDFLLYLVDAGRSSSTISSYLASVSYTHLTLPTICSV